MIADSTGHDYPEYPLVDHMEFAYAMRTHRTRGDFQMRIQPLDADHFMRIVAYVLASDNLLFLAEEARLYKESARFELELIKLARMGGHYGQDLILVSQRFQDIPTDVSSQMDEIYFFNLDQEDDLKIAKNYLHELAEELPYLPRFHYLKKTRGIREVTRGVTKRIAA